MGLDAKAACTNPDQKLARLCRIWPNIRPLLNSGLCHALSGKIGVHQTQ